ncbi:hypothetical protein ORI99_07915, partial [Alishewanella sp. SMS9]|nr:hypothetical protein [Alishewanella sp. SMS9]
FRITKLHSSFRDQNIAKRTKSKQQTLTSPEYRRVELTRSSGIKKQGWITSPVFLDQPTECFSFGKKRC